MKHLLSFIYVIAITSLFFSCNNEDSLLITEVNTEASGYNQDLSLLNSLQEIDYCELTPTEYLNIGVHVGEFFDNLAKNDLEIFENNDSNMLNAIYSIYGNDFYLTRDEFIYFYNEYHNVPDSIAANYIDDIITYASIITSENQDSSSIYLNSVLCNMQQCFIANNTQVQSRWLLSSISIWFGAPCGIEIAANIFDAGLTAGVAVLTSASGIGAVAAGASTVSNIGMAVYNMKTDCGKKRRN